MTPSSQVVDGNVMWERVVSGLTNHRPRGFFSLQSDPAVHAVILLGVVWHVVKCGSSRVDFSVFSAFVCFGPMKAVWLGPGFHGSFSSREYGGWGTVHGVPAYAKAVQR